MVLCVDVFVCTAYLKTMTLQTNKKFKDALPDYRTVHNGTVIPLALQYRYGNDYKIGNLFTFLILLLFVRYGDGRVGDHISIFSDSQIYVTLFSFQKIQQ